MAIIAIGTAALLLPIAKSAPGATPFLVALFTATSALSTTGLALTHTPDYWSPFGHVVIALLTQIGGLGVMTAAMLLALLVAKRLGLRNRLLLQAESPRADLGNPRRLLLQIAGIVLRCEAAIALIVAGRLFFAYDYSVGRALWYGVFHAIQAFNNCGFTLFPDSLRTFVDDWWICLPLTIGVIIGATGFPVLSELARGWRTPDRWSVHTRITVFGSLSLLAIGFVTVLGLEWRNPETLGPLSLPSKVLAAFVQGTIPRSGGPQSLDYDAMADETLAIVIGLMFIGGGSASTAGGIKVTTFFLLAFVIWAQLRGEADVVVGRRRIAGSAQRQALTVALLGVALVVGSSLALLGFTSGIRQYKVVFETISAFSTAGLSTGITPHLPAGAQVVLILLMFVGRVGTLVAGSALALHARHRRYRYPEERPIVG
ncbi:TrkH family potassium uptake protein [Micromonospora sp. HM5-17]|jgi:potassium uptake TrkH family protein|uniref:TrkH family potassium uptake protein n=1 Tax=Micromonospora sp. HM5-17 TaxID=2487710 RepID=UPI001F3395FA|nr:potassium transporter TrkG [Micromonospora sp. HM5-17]